MKLLIIKCFVVFLFVNYSVLANDEQRQIKSLTSVMEAFETNEADQVWPNYKLNEIPTAVHTKTGNIYAFYLDPSPLWEKITINQTELLFSSKDHWNITKMMMHLSFKLEGQPSFVYCLENHQEDSGVNLPLLTFVHERFHLYQFKHFTKQEAGAHYQDEWNEENQILIGFENRLFTEFLMQPNKMEVQKELIKDFIVVNTQRLKLLHPSSIQWEDLQQQMEGLADYVGIKTFEVFPLVKNFSKEKTLLELRAKKMGKEFSIIGDSIKSRHYFIGSTIGFALDRWKVDWKKQAEKGVPLRTLLSQAFPMTNQEMQNRFKRIKASPDFKKNSEEVKSALNQEKQQHRELVKSFHESPGIAVHVDRPPSPMSGGGKNIKSYFLGDRLTLALGDTSYSTSQDQLWRLRFKAIPFVMDDPKGGRSFKLNEEVLIKVNKNLISHLELSGEPISFTELSWNDEHCEFETELPGHIFVDRGVIQIKFLK